MEPAEKSFLVLAAGDISCPKEASSTKKELCQGKSVFRAMPPADAILAAGDLLQKTRPTRGAYRQNFFRTWPVPPRKLYPVPGNHDYRSIRGRKQNEGYRAFLRSQKLGSRSRWYSAHLGEWKLVALDSNCDWTDCSMDGRQMSWLRQTLQNSPRCTLALFHHPLFHGQEKEKELQNQWGIRNIWKILDKHHVDVVVNGHWHYYKRFSPLGADGQPGSIRSFTVGTGGVSLFKAKYHPAVENFVREFGFLSLDLRSQSYSWSFIDRHGEERDSGESSCST